MAMTLAEMLDAIMGEPSLSTSAHQFIASETGQLLARLKGPAIAMFITGLDIGLEITRRYGRPSDEGEFEIVYAPGPREYRFGEGGRA